MNRRGFMKALTGAVASFAFMGAMRFVEPEYVTALPSSEPTITMLELYNYLKDVWRSDGAAGDPANAISFKDGLTKVDGTKIATWLELPGRLG